jgi:hypothetical protein
MNREQRARYREQFLNEYLSLRRHRRDGWHWVVGVEKAGLEGTSGCTWVHILRGQPMACLECGELLGPGHKALLPDAIAEGLVRIGDAVALTGQE